MPDAVILDLMLPGIDGLEVCRRLRSASHVPILIFVKPQQAIQVPDRVTGLDAGADDYLVKPFAFDEFVARLRALFRRHRMEAAPERYEYADLSLDRRTRQFFRRQEEIQLTAKEFELLELFLRHPNQVLFAQDRSLSMSGNMTLAVEQHYRGLCPLFTDKAGGQRQITPDPDDSRGRLCPARKLAGL